jgi:3-hydroxyisobutyrate dehydrogenase-like beta-hydroxyacid dehydrogenase
MNDKQRVGVIGLGLLGGAIARRLLDQGWGMVGFDLDAGRRAELGRHGATVVESPIDVARSCEQIILCLPTSVVTSQVLETMAGRLRQGQIIVDTTTGDPDEMAAIGADLVRRGIGYLDTTVAGSSAQARAGEVTLLVGGEATTYDACRDLLAAFSKASFHVGPCGSGAKLKLVHNLILGLNRAVLAEGLTLAAALGFDQAEVLDTLRQTPAYSTVMDTKGPKMAIGDFSPQATVSQHLKDVRLILEAGQRNNTSLPLSSVHRQLLESLVAAGHGSLDNSAIIKGFELSKPRTS